MRDRKEDVLASQICLLYFDELRLHVLLGGLTHFKRQRSLP